MSSAGAVVGVLFGLGTIVLLVCASIAVTFMVLYLLHKKGVVNLPILDRIVASIARGRTSGTLQSKWDELYKKMQASSCRDQLIITDHSKAPYATVPDTPLDMRLDWTDFYPELLEHRERGFAGAPAAIKHQIRALYFNFILYWVNHYSLVGYIDVCRDVLDDYAKHAPAEDVAFAREVVAENEQLRARAAECMKPFIKQIEARNKAAAARRVPDYEGYLGECGTALSRYISPKQIANNLNSHYDKLMRRHIKEGIFGVQRYSKSDEESVVSLDIWLEDEPWSVSPGELGQAWLGQKQRQDSVFREINDIFHAKFGFHTKAMVRNYFRSMTGDKRVRKELQPLTDGVYRECDNDVVLKVTGLRWDESIVEELDDGRVVMEKIPVPKVDIVALKSPDFVAVGARVSSLQDVDLSDIVEQVRQLHVDPSITNRTPYWTRIPENMRIAPAASPAVEDVPVAAAAAGAPPAEAGDVAAVSV